MARYDLSSGLQLISLQTALRETVDEFLRPSAPAQVHETANAAHC